MAGGGGQDHHQMTLFMSPPKSDSIDGSPTLTLGRKLTRERALKRNDKRALGGNEIPF